MKRIVPLFFWLFAGSVAAQSPNKSSWAPSDNSTIVRMHRVEQVKLEMPFPDGSSFKNLKLDEVMAAYHIPGLSIAIISNYKIIFSKGYGVVTPGSSRPVTPTTLFQAASVSKPVTAMASMALVDKHVLMLDEDVNHFLTTWKVPSNTFTEQHPVTLRELISHRAGVNVHGFAGYNRNQSLPTLIQILDGVKPANNPPIRVTAVPGEQESYSGGGIVIEQLLLTDVTHKPFSAIMDDLVLHKLGMINSTFTQPLASEWRSKAASGTNSNGKAVPNQWFVYPEQGPAGLWTTATNLARFAIGLARACNGTPRAILSQPLAKAMVTPFNDGGAQCFHLDPINKGLFSHNGQNEGFESLLVMNWKTGNGLVLLANSDNGEYLWDILLQGVSKEFGWNYHFDQKPKEWLLMAQIAGVDAMLKYFNTQKATGLSENEAGEGDLNQMGYFYLSDGQVSKALSIFKDMVQLYPTSANAYDSLGEAYMAAGEKGAAKESYSKSLALNPQNDNAREKILQLERK